MNIHTRNITLFSISQALMMSCNTLIVAASALAGQMLATDKSLATLPLAMQFVATMFTSIPAAMLMQRFGRKRIFMYSTVIGITAAVTASYALFSDQFWFFVLAGLLFGSFNGFGNYYRFAAADSVSEDYKSKAVSYVLAGGVIAAVIGPNLAKFTRDSIEAHPFMGSYASTLVLYVLAFVVLSFIRLHDQPARDEIEHHRRDIKTIISQPVYIVAVLCGMLGYGVMALVMTATPLAMHSHHIDFSDTSMVIQWHVVGMFAPSFFTGHLIKKFGVLSIMFAGGLLALLCVIINLNGHTVNHYLAALIFLGISWNFLFIGATTLLTETYHQSERSIAQSVNDFSVFTTVAISSLSAGALQHYFGWRMVNVGVLPIIVIIILSTGWLYIYRKKTAGAG